MLTRGRMTWAAGAAILMLVLYIFQWAMVYCDPGGPEKLFGLSRSEFLYAAVWQLVSYLFLHHLSHPFGLCFTLFGLIIFGSELEGLIGRAHFAVLFVCSGIVAGVAFLAISTHGLLLGAVRDRVVGNACSAVQRAEVDSAVVDVHVVAVRPCHRRVVEREPVDGVAEDPVVPERAREGHV